jgi:hypothetical protein
MWWRTALVTGISHEGRSVGVLARWLVATRRNVLGDDASEWEQPPKRNSELAAYCLMAVARLSGELVSHNLCQQVSQVGTTSPIRRLLVGVVPRPLSPF